MTAEALIAMPLPQIVGLIGAGLYMVNYSLLSLRVLSGDSARYFALNLLAALLVMISLTQSFNLAAATIQSFWVVVSIVSIIVRVRRRATPPPIFRSQTSLGPADAA